MSWKKFAPLRFGSSLVRTTLGIVAALFWAGLAGGQLRAAPTPPAPVAAPAAPRIKTTDADNHTIILNKPGMISVVIGTSEDSQDAARRAGKAMYPFQGKPDFQLVVVVDLRDSIASWVPSVVIDHMRRSLDQEAIELKPYYLKNGNTENPRRYCHVVPDFKGTIVPLLDWSGTPDELHATLFGADGRVIQKWENVDSMEKFQSAVRSALQAFEASRPKLPPGAKPPAH